MRRARTLTVMAAFVGLLFSTGGLEVSAADTPMPAPARR
jgi:hypothetical protein